MIERVRPRKVSIERVRPKKRRREPPNRIAFTDAAIRRLKSPTDGQELYWDSGCRGLSLLVGKGGTKTFRSMFKLHGAWVTRTLGRFGEVKERQAGEESGDTAWAREQLRNDRILAHKGNDPRTAKQKGPDLTFEYVVGQFIELHAKPRQRTWDQTERVLRNNCSPWLKKPMASITKQDARTLLRGFQADGHEYKGAVTQRWLKKLWKWAYGEDLVPVQMMDGVHIDFRTRHRERVYSEAELKSIWSAADGLSPRDAAFVKLLILLAPRKTALACMSWTDLSDRDEPQIWTTPFDLTKSRARSNSKRVYLTPLPPLARRVLKGLREVDSDSKRVFDELPVHTTKAGRPTFYGIGLRDQLIKLGAPKDFAYHTIRHTVTTWLQTAGHSEWECGLILNHAGSGVTAGYSHGYPLELKRQLLIKWAEHVERLVTPEGVALLR